ncbi:hypothetical protein JCM19046_2800 [Bacillus sp. JCM 19046]|nr:hypothetical protein JCM19046_2800 [Bacillus sp. JCM 19046]
MAIWNEDNSGTAFSTLTDEVLQEAERRFGVQLPEAYVELLKQQNGGSLEANAVPSPSEKIEEPYIEVTEIYGIGEDMGIYDTSYLIQEWELPEKIVLFSGTGHAWLAFDYRKTSANPPIVYIETDAETKVYKLADDFAQFLGMLYIEESEIDEEYDDWNEWSEEEFDQLLSEGTDEEELSVALLSVSQSTTDYQWLGRFSCV